MDVILLEDIRSLGRRGEIVKVKPGYARNFLVPRGMALEATHGNIAYFEHQKKKIEARLAKEREEAAAIAAEIAGVRVTIAKRVGETETLYGSVTTAEIAEALAEKGIIVDKRQIELETEGSGLKTLGDHTVSIDLHTDVVAELTVSVVAEE